MDKKAAINLAVDCIRHVMKEKRKTHYFPPEREKLEERLKAYDEAIITLEGLKDANET